jgi:hypothetical protein
LHDSHSPPLEDLPPQEQVRCSSLGRAGDKAGVVDRIGFFWCIDMRPL